MQPSKLQFVLLLRLPSSDPSRLVKAVIPLTSIALVILRAHPEGRDDTNG